MILLPTELWIHIFESVDCCDTLFLCRSLSKQFYPICIQILYKNMLQKLEKSPNLQMNLSSAHCLTEFEKYELIPLAVKAPWMSHVSQEWPRLQFQSFKSAQIGSKGLSQVIAECCVNLSKSDTPDSKDLTRILEYLKSSCQGISIGMPNRTMSAYESIFRRLYTSFQSIDGNTDSSSLISFVMSVWQLLDIITPNTLRDAHFCSRDDCCNGEIQIRLSETQKENDLLETEIVQECTKLDDGWKEQKKEFWYEKGRAEVNEWIDVEIVWLRGRDYSGECPRRVMEFQLNVHPLWIVKSGLGK